MSKILVTGGAGYIGSHTTHLLLERGHDVIVVDDLSRGHRHNVPENRLRVFSIADQAALSDLMAGESFDAVIHFAGLISVGESAHKPEWYFSVNVGGSLSLLSAMREHNIRRLVFSSTAAVYGTPAEVPITEEAPFAPVSPYGESKVVVEKVLGWLDQCSGLRSVALRYFNASGAHPSAGLGEEHEPETHLIPLLFRAIETGRPVTIFGEDYETPDGTCIRDYIHVCDLAEAHILAVEWLLDGRPSDAFNVGTGEGHSVWDVVRAVEQVTGRRVPFEIGSRRAGDPPALVASADKLRRTLGWAPRYTQLTEIVSTAWEFRRKQAAGGAGV